MIIRVFIFISLLFSGYLKAEIIFENGSNAMGIPFKNINDKMYLEITINDTLDKEVMFDTGMGFRGVLCLDPQVGTELGLIYQSSFELGGAGEDEGPLIANVSMGNYISVPGVKISDQMLLVMTKERENIYNWPANAILGISFFDSIVEIDFEQEVINLYNPSYFDKSGYEEEIRIKSFSSGIPVIEVDISINQEKEYPIDLIVDTGCEVPFLYSFTSKDILLPEKIHLTESRILAEGMAGEMTGVMGRISSLRLGEYDFEKVITIYPDQKSWEKATVLGQDGIMGLSVLSQFNVVFDYAGNRILLKPNANFGSPFEFENLGIVSQFDQDKNVEIVDVFLDSPAYKAGLLSGDIIRKIDGRKVSEISYEELIDIIKQENVTIDLILIRDEEIINKTVKLLKFI